MTRRVTHGAAPCGWRTRLLAALIGVSTLLMAAACGQAAHPDGDVLPGRSRPLMAHDWPHPRDYRFEAVTFMAPDPGEVVTTSSGVRALVLSSPDETVVRVTAALPLGRFYEGAGEAGAAGYIARLLADPAGWPAGRPFAARLAELGSQVQVEQSLDATRVSIEALSADWQEAVRLLVDLLRGLKPDPIALRAYRTGPGHASVLAGVDGPGFRPALELERLVAGYPLAPPDPGLALTAAAVHAVIADALAGNAVVIGIGGHVPRSEAVALLEAATRGWPAGRSRTRTAVVPSQSTTPSFVVMDAPALEGWLAIGRYLPPVPVEEQPALAVMADVLGERLNIAAREVRGLANRNNFLLPEDADYAGLMHIRSGGRPEAVAPLVKVGLTEIARLRDEGDRIADEELERAKGALVHGRWQAALDGVRSASSTYAGELLRHGSLGRLYAWPGKVQAVSATDVKAAAARYLDPADLKTVVVGPEERINAARHPRWPATLAEFVR